MMKKILLLILMSVTLAHLSMGQAATATLGDYTAAPGTQVVVPVDVTGFNDVAAITLYFEYDPDVVSYVSAQSPAVLGMDVNGSAWPDGKYRIAIAWSAVNPATITGTLVEVIFNYTGGESALIWTQSWCEVSKTDYTPLPVIYSDGSIGPVGEAEVWIEDQLEVPPGNLAIPLNVDFSGVTNGVSSFTFTVLYDDNILNWQSASEIHPDFSALSVYQFSSPSRLVFDWVNPDNLATEGSKLIGTLLKMNFQYAGGNTTLTFDEAQCAMADNDVIEVSVIYTEGEVTQDPNSLITVTLPQKQENPGATGVAFPLTATNFSNITTFDLRINFNPSVLSFVGLSNYLSPLSAPQFQVYETNGELGISWVGGPITFTSADLFDIVFDYASGNSDLFFDVNFCAVANDDLIELSVDYFNGSVSEAMIYEATATIPDLLATTGQPIDVPVYVTGFENLGAINFHIIFDPGVIGFVQILNVHSGLTGAGTSFSNVSGTNLFFEWVADPMLTSGPDIPDNDKLFDMQFNFIGGSSALSFNTGNCEVSRADPNITQILVTYTDGSVYGGIVSLVESTITADPVEMEVGQQSIITVQLKDQLGNNLPGSGGVVALSTTLGSLSAVTDNNNGTYTATLTSAESGTATITGTLNGDAFVDDATVQIYYILTLEVESGGTAGDEGKVKIGTEEYGPGTHQISITTADVLLEAVNGTKWKIYSWEENSVLQSPLGATSYNVTMNADKTVKATFHLPGDANCDGSVTVSDITTMVAHINSENPPVFCYENADVNLDGDISVTDITIIVNIILNQ